MSEGTKKKLSEINKGKKLSEETKKKISEAGKGRACSKKTRGRISKAHKGNKLSKDHCIKLSIAHIGNIPHNKGMTYEESYGEEKAAKLKEVISKQHKNSKRPPRSKEHRENLSRSKKGKVSKLKGRTYEDIYGVEKALELKKKKSSRSNY